jgi:hypothetical protein
VLIVGVKIHAAMSENVHFLLLPLWTHSAISAPVIAPIAVISLILVSAMFLFPNKKPPQWAVIVKKPSY